MTTYEHVPPDQRSALFQFRETHPLQQTTIEGRTWHYIDTGGHMPALLILVGGLRVADAAFRAITHLEDDFRVIAPTYPALDSMETLTNGLVALLDNIELERANVLAGSFGGMIAQVLAHRFPARIDRLVLSSTGVPDIASYQQTLRLMSLTPGPLVRQQSKKRLFDLMQPPPEQQAFWHAYLEELFSERLEKRDMLSTLRCIIDYGTNYTTARWDGNVLILQAADDETFDSKAQEALHRRYPQAQLHRFEAGGHSPSMTRPDEYFAVVRRFLQTG